MPTVPERLAQMEVTLERLDHTLNGNGQPGLAQKLERFITEQYRLSDRLTVVESSVNHHNDGHHKKKLDWQWLVTAAIGAAAVFVAIYK